MHYLLLISGVFTLALAGDIAFFIYGVHNVVFKACMYVCKVYICALTTPKHIPYNNWTLSGMVRSINVIFPKATEQYVVLCCRCQKVKFSRPYSPEENGRTAYPLDVHTATTILELTKLRTGN